MKLAAQKGKNLDLKALVDEKFNIYTGVKLPEDDAGSFKSIEVSNLSQVHAFRLSRLSAVQQSDKLPELDQLPINLTVNPTPAMR